MNSKKGSMEDPNSNFNQHRLAVIRYSIEKNLSIAIANYNNYTGVSTDFRMPQLKEDEWSKIINNISIISFLQGLNIGGKVYNGYSIINNTKNNEYVSEDAIYIAEKDDQKYYYNITDSELEPMGNYIGVLNTDFERRKYTDTNGITRYFFPKRQLGSYTSIVNQQNVDTIEDGNIYKYVAEKGGNIAKAYFTALGRERYSMYRTNNYNYETKNVIPDAKGNIELVQITYSNSGHPYNHNVTTSANITLSTKTEFGIQYSVNNTTDWKPYTGQITGLKVGDILYARLIENNSSKTGPFTSFEIYDKNKPEITNIYGYYNGNNEYYISTVCPFDWETGVNLSELEFLFKTTDGIYSSGWIKKDDYTFKNLKNDITRGFRAYVRDKYGNVSDPKLVVISPSDGTQSITGQ